MYRIAFHTLLLTGFKYFHWYMTKIILEHLILTLDPSIPYITAYTYVHIIGCIKVRYVHAQKVDSPTVPTSWGPLA